MRTAPPARKNTLASASIAQMMTPLRVLMETAVMPMAAASMPKAPAKAPYEVVAGALPIHWLWIKVMERPRTTALKMS